jgi:beta-glucanase (GH16 family)
MKYLLLILYSLLYFACTNGQTIKDNTKLIKTLTWSDEFDYEGLPDKSNWSYEEGFVRNNEPQFYTVDRKQNAYVKDGFLKITAIKEDYDGADYTSASINTKGKFEFTYGRLEVRAKIPEGNGVWPAIWTLGVNINEVSWPLCGEIDILEFWGHNPEFVHANVHTGNYNHSVGKGRGGKIKVENPWEDFHIYSVEWYSDRLCFFFDEILYYTCYKKNEGIGEWPFDNPQYLLLNLALISDLENIDDNILPADYLIDYVRYYQFTE